MRNWLLSACVLGVVGSVGLGAPATAPAGGAAGGASKARMTATAIPAPEFIVGKSDAEGGVKVISGVLVGKQRIRLNPGMDKTEATIGGMAAAFSLNGERVTVKWDGGTATLQPNGAGYRAVSLKMKNRMYTVAFPWASVFAQQGEINYRAGFAMRGTVGGQVLMLYDDNGDGAYTVGEDSIRAAGGNSPVNVFAPISKYLATGQNVLQIEDIAVDGAEVTWSRCAEKTAKVALAFGSGDGELHAAFRSRDANVSFVASVGRAGANMVLLPGNYEFLYGVVYSPRAGKIAATVVPSSLKPFEIGVDGRVKAQKIALGGPFKLEFKLESRGMKLTIKPNGFKVRGSAGEEYAGVNCVGAQVGLAGGGRMMTLGQMVLGQDGSLGDFSAPLPQGAMGQPGIKIIIMATVEGFGQVQGEAALSGD